jgi:serine protease AprX
MVPPPRLVDRDRDRLSDDLQAKLAQARPEDRFRVVVSFAGPGDAASARAAVGDFELHREFTIIHGFAATMTAAQIQALARKPDVLRIEEDFPVSIKLDAARHDFGADAAAANYGATGAGVGICIVDTGADPGHEQLDRAPIPFYDAINGQSTPYDDHGHGTHVASICCGDGVGGANAARYHGVAPGSGLRVAKVLDASGSGSDSQVISGIEWCVAQPGVRIISMSLGGPPTDGGDSLSQAVNSAVASGVTVVAAAGNEGDAPETVATPGAATGAIAVGAVAEWSAPAGAANHSEGIYLDAFSSRGPIPDGRTKPDIVAPGDSITAARAGTTTGYVTYSGTSMATPFVAGAVALALQANPGLNPAGLRLLLEGSAQDRGSPGKDNDWGAGLVDVNALVARAKGLADYQPTPFPAYNRVTDSVADGDTWMYPLQIATADLGVPIAASITAEGKTTCVLSFGNLCFYEQWLPDLDARLKDPTGAVVAESLCLLQGDCGMVGRQETLHVLPTQAGTYWIEVWPSADDVNLGKGGSFHLDLSKGPATGASPPPPPPPPLSLHVGDLDGSTLAIRRAWRASVSAGVHDGSEQPLAGAVITGTWSGGFSGTASCTTGIDGRCSVTSGKMSGSRTSVNFTVTQVTKSGYSYFPSQNHDPDGDSTGTAITVVKP